MDARSPTTTNDKATCVKLPDVRGQAMAGPSIMGDNVPPRIQSGIDTSKEWLGLV
jgi:hypothetical protein